MGQAFARVVKEWVNEGDHTASQLTEWAEVSVTASTNWKNGTALPERSNLDRMLKHVAPDWAGKFRDAWKEDQTLPEVWRDYLTLRAINLETSGLQDEHEFGALTRGLSHADREALYSLVEMCAGTPGVTTEVLEYARYVVSRKGGSQGGGGVR